MLLAALLVASAAAAAQAQTVEERLAEARAERARALFALSALEGRIAALQGEAADVEASLEETAGELLAAYQREIDAATEVSLAEDLLAARARAAYQLGPAASLALFLTADSLSDVIEAQEFAVSAMEADVVALEAVELARARLARERAAVEETKLALEEQERTFDDLLAEMEQRLAEAHLVAGEAGIRVEALEAELAAQQQAIEAARARRQSREHVVIDPANGADQSDLLALLGPRDGRGCAIPEGLVDTGDDISGLASWYGWDFAGRPTASGAIYDPRLFTAAHRDLPFGTFLRVRYGERCAIVLVNDRGPYADEARVLDLSMAAAQYLGVGVSPFSADILHPA
jgi:rare lipoprotein A